MSESPTKQRRAAAHADAVVRTVRSVTGPRREHGLEGGSALGTSSVVRACVTHALAPSHIHTVALLTVPHALLLSSVSCHTCDEHERARGGMNK
eukprot:353561-Chlamydomonas_euryale.AAC.2